VTRSVATWTFMRWLWTRQYAFIQKNFPLAHNKRNKSTVAVSPLILRPYQESCIHACTDALAQGVSRIGISLPTGSGKTAVFVSLLSRIPAPAITPKATRSLVIVNSIELARQAAAQAQTLFPDWIVEIEQGVKHKASGSADMYAPSL
jgi:ATP-dependent helicase IRC3